jgi:hypothetical protein
MVYLLDIEGNGANDGYSRKGDNVVISIEITYTDFI